MSHRPTAQEWQEVLRRANHRCYLCGQPSDRLEIEHLIPRALGGSNHITNLAPACRRCNARKGKRTVYDLLSPSDVVDLHRRLHSGLKGPTPMTRLESAVLDTLLPPRNVRGIVRDRLATLTKTIFDCHGNPERFAEEREALGQLAALSEILYNDPNRLPAALRKTLLVKVDGVVQEDDACHN